jgi:peroxiredoxin
MPMMESVSKSLKEEGLVVLAINLKEDKDIVQEYIREGRFTFRVLLDKSGDVSDKFQVFGLPSTYFIDKKGIIQYNFMGEMTKEIINTGLKAISVKGV